MPVASPSAGYLKMIAYGQHKAELRHDKLALQSFLAGFWVAVYGHCCTVFAGAFFNVADPAASTGLCKLAYGALFPGAFVAVIYPGTELFTGNTATMIMLCFNDGWKRFPHLLRVWGLSFVGNISGAAFGAFLITYLSGAFKDGSRSQAFLFDMAFHKVDHTFIENLSLGIGCNMMVCLATWCCVISDDGAGKVLAIFYSVGVFAMGGYEHIIANFYTLTAAHMVGYDQTSFGTTIVKNWIPVLIGNLISGTFFTGTLWWYALHPQFSDLAPYTNEELARELTSRTGSVAVAMTDTEGGDTRWRRGSSVATKNQSFVFAPPLFSPDPATAQANSQQDFTIFTGNTPKEGTTAPTAPTSPADTTGKR